MDHDGRFSAWLHGAERLSDLHRCTNRWNRHSPKLKLNRSCDRPVIDRRGRYFNGAQQARLQRTIHLHGRDSTKFSQGIVKAARRIIEHLIVRLIGRIEENVGMIGGPDKLRTAGSVEERWPARRIPLTLGKQSGDHPRCGTRIVEPTHHHIRRTVGQLLCTVVFSHGADTRSILTCQIQRRHAGDPKQEDQHERREKHVTLVARTYEF